MKYIIVLGDGMADEPIDELGGKTPLEYADTPVMDELAAVSEIGLVRTVPAGMKPGSDTANLSVLGYNPEVYYTGRSPLEALSIGVSMRDTDIAIRCNLVTVSQEQEKYAEKVMLDHSAGEISTEEADVLLEDLNEKLGNAIFQFYKGVSYRHLLIWEEGNTVELTPPHDILGKNVGAYMPQESALREMVEASFSILKDHPVNQNRVKRGLAPANSIWFWGAGTKPALSSFEEMNKKKGVMISAVDLLKGIAVGSGLTNIDVEGADGTLHTNYEGKAQAAIDSLLRDGYDFAYVHIEAPDEMGHQGSQERKVKAIQYLDSRILRPITEALDRAKEEYRLLILPDHPTPVKIRTHTDNPVPYLLYDSSVKQNKDWHYNEREAEAGGNRVEQGYKMVSLLFQTIEPDLP